MNRIAETVQENGAHLRLMLEHSEQNKDILLGIIDDVCASHSEVERALIGVVRDIVGALESRRWWTRERSLKVASHALKIAEAMGLHDDVKRTLHIGALLHDVGQSLFHDALTDKPVKLTAGELKLVRQHPVQGAAVLNRTRELRDVMPLIRHHHERMDGSGYPDGLKGNEIPAGARIIHLASAFESMVSDRPHRLAKNREYALREIERCKNTQFDPVIAEVGLRVL